MQTAHVFPRCRVGNHVTTFNKAFCIALDFRRQPSGAWSCSNHRKDRRRLHGPFSPVFVFSSSTASRFFPPRDAILWDYKSSYYSWGILASGGAYVFGRDGKDNVKDTGLAVPGAVQALSEIIELVRAEVLPKSVSYGAVEDQMAQGKLAMLISGPWAWSNLIKSGIDFGVAPIPGVKGNLGRPFVGVSVAYLNRSSPNQDLAKEFIERYLLTEGAFSNGSRQTDRAART
jgi:hypothetical protein